MSARAKTPTTRGPAPASSSGKIPKQPSTDEIPTEILGPDFANKQQAKSLPQPPPSPRPKGKTAPLPENQMKAISMKTPGATKKVEMPASEMPHVKLRAMSEFNRANTPQNLGNLAPPYDPSEARKRSVQEYVFWGCVAVIIASGIALVVWFVAR